MLSRGVQNHIQPVFDNRYIVKNGDIGSQSVTGDITFLDTITLAGDVVLIGDITVQGDATFNGDVTINGNSTFNARPTFNTAILVYTDNGINYYNGTDPDISGNIYDIARVGDVGATDKPLFSYDPDPKYYSVGSFVFRRNGTSGANGTTPFWTSLAGIMAYSLTLNGLYCMQFCRDVGTYKEMDIVSNLGSDCIYFRTYDGTGTSSGDRTGYPIVIETSTGNMAFSGSTNNLWVGDVDINGANLRSLTSQIMTEFVQTPTATGDGQTLVAVKIDPTFADGAYTGVSHYGLWIESGLFHCTDGIEIDSLQNNAALLFKIWNGMASFVTSLGVYNGHSTQTGYFTISKSGANPYLSITTAGGTDDPHVTYSDDTINFSHGIDRSEGLFVLTPNATPGGNTHLVMDTSGNVGLGVDPTSLFEVYSSTANPVLTITAEHATDYDPQIHFRTDSAPTVKFVMGVDATSDTFVLGYNTTVGAVAAAAYATGLGMLSDGHVGMGRAPTANFLLAITFAATNTSGRGAYYVTSRSYATANGSYTNYGFLADVEAYVNNGVTNSGSVDAVLFNARGRNTGTLTNLIGLDFSVGKYGNTTGNITNVYGTILRPTAGSNVTPTITNYYCNYISGYGGGGATVTNYYCYRIANQTGTITNGWNFYTAWDAPIRTVGHFRLDADSRYYYCGAAQDAGITYDGTDLLIYANLVGTGSTKFKDNSIFIEVIKSGATQGAAGAAAHEVWKTASHATLPDNVLMIGV